MVLRAYEPCIVVTEKFPDKNGIEIRITATPKNWKISIGEDGDEHSMDLWEVSRAILITTCFEWEELGA